MTKRFLITASVMGATSVLVGTIGSLVLSGNVDAENMDQLNNGLLFQVFNTVVILAITFMNRYVVRAYINAIYFLFVFGTALYSIPLYLLSLSDLTGNIFSALTPAIPIGALLIFSGWIVLFFSGLSYKHKKRTSKG